MYLPSGQECHLIEKVGERFLVSPIFIVETEEGEFDTEGSPILVDAVFDKKPIEKISEDIRLLQHQQLDHKEQLSKLQQEKRRIESEIAILQRTQVSQEKFIINKTDLLKAKEIVLFQQDSVMPIIRKDNFNQIKMHFEIEINYGGERVWGYKFYDNRGDIGSSRFLCPKYGILIDPTEEEVEEVILKRLTEFSWEDHSLEYVDDKYLSDEMIARKHKYIEDRKAQAISYAELQLKNAQDNLDKLRQP